MQSLKLNIGARDHILKSYHNIDIRYLSGLTIIADVESLPYASDTVDEILALDVYEHISYHKSKKLLKHWVSLLKPGGLLRIQAPCLDNVISYIKDAILSINPNYIITVEDGYFKKDVVGAVK